MLKLHVNLLANIWPTSKLAKKICLCTFLRWAQSCFKKKKNKIKHNFSLSWKIRDLRVIWLQSSCYSLSFWFCHFLFILTFCPVLLFFSSLCLFSQTHLCSVSNHPLCFQVVVFPSVFVSSSVLICSVLMFLCLPVPSSHHVIFIPDPLQYFWFVLCLLIYNLLLVCCFFSCTLCALHFGLACLK